MADWERMYHEAEAEGDLTAVTQDLANAREQGQDLLNRLTDATAEITRLRTVISVTSLPYIRISTYHHKSRHQVNEWDGYAAVMYNAIPSHDNWCHLVKDGLSPWHRSEADAWECFETNHPGLRAAIAYTQEIQTIA